MKLADKKSIAGLLDLLEDKQFESKINTVMDAIRNSSIFIAKRYNDLLVEAKKEYEVAERLLVSRIVTTIYKEVEKIKKKYEKADRLPENMDTYIQLDISKWKEFKIYNEFVSPYDYGTDSEKALRGSLKKFGLDKDIQCMYWVDYIGGTEMYIQYNITSDKTVLDI